MIRRLTIIGLVLIGIGLLILFGSTHWLQDIRGWSGSVTNANGSSYDVYQAYSGFIPALAILGLFATGITGLRHLNCHQPGCWRFGHPMPKGYRLCKVHAKCSSKELNLHEIHPDHGHETIRVAGTPKRVVKKAAPK